jgi:PIN domain nuclease of toxin-antitoxin system
LRLLLDTHALLWWLDGDPKLSARAVAAITADPSKVQVSAVSAWEITTKARIGKLPEALDVATDVAGCVTREGFQPLSLTIGHGQRAGPTRAAARSIRPHADRPGDAREPPRRID